MFNKLKIIIGVLIGLIWVLFFIKAAIAVDTDFGWHLKTGELILESGIPKTDPFSYTMPSYQFVNHEWLTDVFLAKIFPVIGFWGLGIISTLIALSSVLLLVNFRELKKLDLIILISSLILLYFGGSRAQLITWFFLSLLFWIIARIENWDKYKYGLPLLFLIWSNLHGGFLAGLIVLGIIIAGKTIEQKKVKIPDLLVLFSSILITLINPYGINLWKEVLVSANDSRLRFIINEWMPPFFRFDLAFLSLLALASFLIFKFRKKLFLFESLLYLFFTGLALLSSRHIPLWLLLILALTPKLLSFVLEMLPDAESTERILKNSYLVAGMFALVITAVSLSSSVPKIYKYRLDKHYPIAAVEYIKIHQPPPQMIAPYTWGSYIIWQLPNYKVFIDGRMPSWKNYNPAANESSSIMEEYQNFLSGKINREQILDKYGVNTILWPSKVPKQNFPTSLNPKKWEEIYRDQTSVIYTRKQ